jgi:hypothetical protein
MRSCPGATEGGGETETEPEDKADDSPKPDTTGLAEETDSGDLGPDPAMARTRGERGNGIGYPKQGSGEGRKIPMAEMCRRWRGRTSRQSPNLP